MKKQNPVVWFEIYVEDINRAAKFYESVFGVQLDDMADPSNPSILMKVFPGNMESYGVPGALVKMEGMKAGGNSTIVYLGCEDCAVEESRVVASGGQVHQSKMSIGEHGFISLAVDTEGNIIGLHSMK
ncbi:VOC family protein [Maribellus sp. CM-23]|uniref:VOC family protein n=1 Tax=Maribellus sp. CM-23 TaxID=2781026 RepID=UPI001F323568|nr:VOC family protein [Maribellus sp. CM-23]MCE4564364.1 VOC family protein [Maribellus sp. CM-23]